MTRISSHLLFRMYSDPQGAEALLQPRGSVLVIAAHPDDETIGASAGLARWDPLYIVHVTDGAPRDGRDARAQGFPDCQAYAGARRQELAAALAVLGASHAQLIELGFADQTAGLQLERLTEAIAGVVRNLQPELVLTHPYEGGHPDHDACAFAARRALQITGARAQLIEFTSYHAHHGRIRTGEFLQPNPPATPVVLSAAERERKRRALRCFATQRETLKFFQVEHELYRTAPEYDFTRPPNSGTLFYEQFNWGMTGSEFCRRAALAIEPAEVLAV